VIQFTSVSSFPVIFIINSELNYNFVTFSNAEIFTCVSAAEDCHGKV